MADEFLPPHWNDGRIVDAQPRPAGSPWLWLTAVALLVLAIDLVLGLGPGDQPNATPRSTLEPVDRATVRERLLAAAAAGDEGRRSFVLIGDSVLAGDVMAASVPDWGSQRVVDHMRAELGPRSIASFEQIAFDGLLPIDALHVLGELDRIDPDADVTLVLELNLRYFSDAYAEQTSCTRAELCELGRTQLAGDLPRREPAGTIERATIGVLESAGLARDWLRRRAPIVRHRAQLQRPTLAELDGIAIARADRGTSSITRAEGLARVSAHYRDAALPGTHAQLVALAQIVERLRARGRSATLFFTPLEDEFVRATLPGNRIGDRQARVTGLIHDRGLDRGGSARPVRIEVLDLDHPLFGGEYFLDHVHLEPAGNRMLALNLLHELGLPLRERPFDWMMIHGEDHDRSLVHRRGLGYADGGATRALFRGPEGVAVSQTGDWIVVADTGNHVLRELRGSMQIVERLAGEQQHPGFVDGAGDNALLERPRSPEIVGDAVYFIDGAERQRVREYTFDRVETLRWSGPSCVAYHELEARDRRLYVLCADDRVLTIDLDNRAATIAFDPRATDRRIVGIRRIEPTGDGRLLLADADSRIWAITPDAPRPPQLLFANHGRALLPGSSYPYSFAQMRLNRIVAMEWVERYGALLVQDEHDLGKHHKRLQREETERVHLRLLDLDNQRIYPWIKAIPHGDAFLMWNEVTSNLVSYFHVGAMAIVEADASLVHVERTRSRLIRIADGLLAAAKAGGLESEVAEGFVNSAITTDTASQISATFRPDRFLPRRHEPIPRAGPHVALVVGSSLSAISDRVGNYGLARLLELELGGELGYRDGVRLDVYARMLADASLTNATTTFADFLDAEGPAPDIVMFELSESSGGGDSDDLLNRIEQLASRHDTLVIFYDNSAMFADGRDGLRARSAGTKQLIAAIRERGLLLLEPSDQLLRELLVESPWSSQTWGPGRHHGAPWAIELTAKVLTHGAYPSIREFLDERTPAAQRVRRASP